MTKRYPPMISRRGFNKAMTLGALGLAAPSIMTGRALAADKSITVTSWGGDYHKRVKEVFADPFTQESGITVNLVDNGDMAKVKAQVMSKSVVWDVIDAPAAFATSGAKDDLWETLDASLVPPESVLQKPHALYMPWYLYSGGIVWDDKRNPGSKHPMDFAGFFDTEKFPGRRCMRALAPETLEAALVADGVAPKDLYPLDVERAFKVLDKLKPHVSKFAATTPEQVTSVSQNEADFSYSYYNRVQALQQGGSSLQFSFEQTNNSLDFLAIPKGSKNKEAAMQFIAFCMRQDRQTAWALSGFYLPNNLASITQIKASPNGGFLPDLENGKNVVINPEWWGENYTQVQKRYSEWLIS